MVLLKQKKYHLLSAVSPSDKVRVKGIWQENWLVCHSNPAALLKEQMTSFRWHSADKCHLSVRR